MMLLLGNEGPGFVMQCGALYGTARQGKEIIIFCKDMSRRAKRGEEW